MTDRSVSNSDDQPSYDPGNLNLVNRGSFQRADCVGDGNLANRYRLRHFSALSPARAGPGAVAIAGGLSKAFAVKERVHIKFESTFTNLPSHLNHAPPATGVSSPSTFWQDYQRQTSENAGNRTGPASFTD